MRITKKLIMDKIETFYKLAKANSYIRKPYSNALYRTWRFINAVEKERKYKDE